MRQGRIWIAGLVILAISGLACVPPLRVAGPARKAEEDLERVPARLSTLAEIRFATGAAVLNAGSRSILDALALRIRAKGGGLYLEVQGHADAVGDPSANRRLAADRAEIVRHYLHAVGGIPLARIGLVVLGASAPEADNGTPEGRERNRRVVIVAVR